MFDNNYYYELFIYLLFIIINNISLKVWPFVVINVCLYKLSDVCLSQ